MNLVNTGISIFEDELQWKCVSFTVSQCVQNNGSWK